MLTTPTGALDPPEEWTQCIILRTRSPAHRKVAALWMSGRDIEKSYSVALTALQMAVWRFVEGTTTRADLQFDFKISEAIAGPWIEQTSHHLCLEHGGAHCDYCEVPWPCPKAGDRR